MSEELRKIITGYGSDPDDWTFAEDEASYEGESADGVPSWAIRESVYSGFVIRREHGWYEQQGDADSVEEAVKLMRAMDAAEEALNAALRIAEMTRLILRDWCWLHRIGRE